MFLKVIYEIYQIFLNLFHVKHLFRETQKDAHKGTSFRKGLDKEMGMSGTDALHPVESMVAGHAGLVVLITCDFGIRIVYSIKLSLSVCCVLASIPASRMASTALCKVLRNIL